MPSDGGQEVTRGRSGTGRGWWSRWRLGRHTPDRLEGRDQLRHDRRVVGHEAHEALARGRCAPDPEQSGVAQLPADEGDGLGAIGDQEPLVLEPAGIGRHLSEVEGVGKDARTARAIGPDVRAGDEQVRVPRVLQLQLRPGLEPDPQVAAARDGLDLARDAEHVASVIGEARRVGQMSDALREPAAHLEMPASPASVGNVQSIAVTSLGAAGRLTIEHAADGTDSPPAPARMSAADP